jgi:hypothetical protein
MANGKYVSSLDVDALSVPVLAATVFAAEESSLFLGGTMIPIVNAPSGLLQVPELAKVTAQTVSSEANPGVDLDAQTISDTKNNIVCELIAARAVVRDLGNIDPNEIGRLLGRSVATAFDKAVYAALDTSVDSTTNCVPLSLDAIFDSVAQIRANGENGQLYSIITPAQANTVVKSIGVAAYAGGDFQTEALRTGYIGSVAGVQMFVSSNITASNTSGYIFGQDALRIAMQKNVDIEIGRRTAAVGNDVVASIHAKPAMIDNSRAIRMINV